MACKFFYSGKEILPEELKSFLREVPLNHARTAMPSISKGSYDAISWTPGEQQAERYDLSKQVDRLQYHPDTHDLIAEKNGRVLIDKKVAPEDLPNTIGKEAADKILNNPSRITKTPAWKVEDKFQNGQILPGKLFVDEGEATHFAKQRGQQPIELRSPQAGLPLHSLEGVDLKVGGEGMKSFYDKMLVDKANAIGKKFGAKVEWNKLDPELKMQKEPDGTYTVFDDAMNSEFIRKYLTKEEAEKILSAKNVVVPTLRLTPQLKEQALKQGLPLFARGGKVATDTYKQQIPGPVGHQEYNRQPKHLPERAAGGRVNPANINREPSEAQKKSGVYAKDHVNLHGLNLTIENAKGSMRNGVDKNGRPWSSELPAHYGYLKNSEGKDGDHLDVYLGPHTKASHVFIIDQLDKDTKKFDEHKIGVGFGSKNQFVTTYKRAFSDGKGAARIGAVHSMTMSQFKNWLKEGDTKAPYKEAERKKLSHKTVGYEVHSERPNKHCSLCTMFVSAEHNGPACTLVANPIDPAGWCRHFRRRKF